MKHSIAFFIFFFSAIFALVHAQDETESNYVSPLKKGDNIFTLNVGYPNWGKYYLSQEFNAYNVSNGVQSGFAPLGLTFEHLISKDISLTFTGYVNAHGGKWRATKELFDGVNYSMETHDYEYNLTRLRFLVGMTYYVSELEVDNFLMHVSASVGANNIRFSESSSDSNWRLRNENYFAFESDNLEIPIAYRVAMGFKYFIGQNMNLGFEAAIGGPTVSFNIGYKF